LSIQNSKQLKARSESEKYEIQLMKFKVKREKNNFEAMTKKEPGSSPLDPG